MSDRELVEMVRDPERRNYGFFLLVQEYQKVLYRLIARMVVRREDAEDILQDTFIKVYQGINHLQDVSKLKFWMMKIATNEALILLRRNRLKSMLRLTDQRSQLPEYLKSYPSISGDEIMEKFQKALLTLAARQRAIFNLKYFEELKYEEVASILGITEGACKAAYHKAVGKIEKSLAEG